MADAAGLLFFYLLRVDAARTDRRAKEIRIANLRVNDEIRATEVRVVAPDGSQVGVKPLREAIWLADQLGLDLVEVAPGATPPVTRLMDYGKYKYEQSVKEREARKKQSRSTVKEIAFRVKIGNHDYEIKRDRALRFLNNGDRVRVRVWLRGREASRPQLGLAILDRLSTDLAEMAKVEQEPKIEGRNMTMAFAPLKRPTRRSVEGSSGPKYEV
jgi:translation initiation factor IF-3